MQLSKETLTILKNFASINSNILIKPGSAFKTISAQKNVLAFADVAETFDTEFGIYDLNEFLGVLGFFSTPDLDFNDKYVTISEGKSKVKYYAADASVLTTPNREIKDLEIKHSFKLETKTFADITKAASILGTNDVSFVGADGILSIVVGDKANATGNNWSTVVGESSDDFKVNLKVDNLKLLPYDYNVEIAAKKIAKFSATSSELTYFVAIESDSTI